MGAYSPAPVLDPAMEERVMRDIVRPVIGAMAREGCPYQGVLYVGLMMTAEGPRVVEFNCRFGDPECQAILPRLDQDLLPLLEAVAVARALPSSVAWKPDASVCVVAASGGYPGAYSTGLPIAGIEEAGRVPGATVFHAGTARSDGRLLTAGGRVLGVQALGKDIREAVVRAYDAIARISFEGMHYRRDIARRAVAR
jgi:phosphoribosylamine--glycine ligase